MRFLHELTKARYFRIVFRLSIVAALASMTVTAYRGYQEWHSAQQEYSRVAGIMDCAIRLSTESITARLNEFGTVDVASSCGAGSDGKTFFTNEKELDDHRNGRFMDIYRPREFELEKIGVSSLTALAATNLLGLVFFLLFNLFRWIFK
jgi:hypothetical protein